MHFVCAGNYGGAGYVSGYNIEGASTCKAFEEMTPFSCLCDVNRHMWVNASGRFVQRHNDGIQI